MKIFGGRIVVINEQQPLEYRDCLIASRRADYRRLIGPARCKTRKKNERIEKRKPPHPSRITVELVNYRRRFLDSIGNVEYPGALLERDRQTASDVRGRERER